MVLPIRNVVIFSFHVRDSKRVTIPQPVISAPGLSARTRILFSALGDGQDWRPLTNGGLVMLVANQTNQTCWLLMLELTGGLGLFVLLANYDWRSCLACWLTNQNVGGLLWVRVMMILKMVNMVHDVQHVGIIELWNHGRAVKPAPCWIGESPAESARSALIWIAGDLPLGLCDLHEGHGCWPLGLIM